MARPMQFLDANNGYQIAGNSTNIRPHPVQEVAQLLDIGLTSSIVNRRCPFREDRSHDDIRRTGDGSLIKQHITTFQFPGMDLIDISLFIPHELRAEMLKA